MSDMSESQICGVRKRTARFEWVCVRHKGHGEEWHETVHDDAHAYFRRRPSHFYVTVREARLRGLI